MTPRPLPNREQLPYALYTAAQVRALDQAAIASHCPGGELMQRAGQAAYDLLRRRWPSAQRLTVLCGQGNNGGDGYVVARLARGDGLEARVLQLGDEGHLTPEAIQMREAWTQSGGTCEAFRALPRNTDLIVDALLGIGLERPLIGDWAAAVQAVNAQRAPVLAIDIPSGLHADTGRVLGCAVRAMVTLSFIGLKQGMFTGAGPEYCGEIHFAGLGIPASLYGREILAARRLDWSKTASQVPRRRRDAHKGDLGHVLIVGGAPGYSGAARLAGEGALRAGGGLVSVATHPAHAAMLNLGRPELMVAAITTPADLTPLLARATAVAIGPGLGQGPWGREFLPPVLAAGKPLVLDADALNWLAQHPSRREDWVLTPHPGEAARLLGCSPAEVQADRFSAARRLRDAFGGTLVLKGAGTLVMGGGRRPPGVCSQGNPGMASGGSGDVLAGMVAAFLARGLAADDAAEVAVCLHAAAGDVAARAGEQGMLASDLIAAIRPTLNQVEVQP